MAMRNIRFVRFVFVLTLCLTTLSFTVLKAESASPDEESAPVLRPKRTAAPPLTPKKVNPPAKPAPILAPRRKSARPVITEESPPEVRHSLPPVRFGLLFLTPLIKQNAFDGRFSAIGLQLPLTFPLFHMTEAHWVASLETGITATYASLSLAQPAVEFTHQYFSVPLYFKINLPKSKDSDFSFEAFAGIQAKIFENDSRPTLDGGFHVVTGGILSNLDPDFGGGVLYSIGTGTTLRLKVSYLFLCGGIEFEF